MGSLCNLLSPIYCWTYCDAWCACCNRGSQLHRPGPIRWYSREGPWVAPHARNQIILPLALWYQGFGRWPHCLSPSLMDVWRWFLYCMMGRLMPIFVSTSGRRTWQHWSSRIIRRWVDFVVSIYQSIDRVFSVGRQRIWSVVQVQWRWPFLIWAFRLVWPLFQHNLAGKSRLHGKLGHLVLPSDPVPSRIVIWAQYLGWVHRMCILVHSRRSLCFRMALQSAVDPWRSGYLSGWLSPWVLRWAVWTKVLPQPWSIRVDSSAWLRDRSLWFLMDEFLSEAGGWPGWVLHSLAQRCSSGCVRRKQNESMRKFAYDIMYFQHKGK